MAHQIINLDSNAVLKMLESINDYDFMSKAGIVKMKLRKGKKKFVIGVFYIEDGDFAAFWTTRFTSSRASKIIARINEHISNSELPVLLNSNIEKES